MYTTGIINILSLSMDSFGTGFFVSPDGNILTCTHVLEKAGYRECGELILYKYADDPNIYEAKWIMNAYKEDLSLLRTNRRTENYIPMGIKNISGVKADSYGFPNGSKEELKASVYIDRIYRNDKYIQLGDANTVTFGFSGAPLIYDNIAVGIIHKVAKTDSNGRLVEVAFAISAKRIFEFFSDDIIRKEICIGYGKRRAACRNYAVSRGGGLCEKCYAAQFSDVVKSIYQAQNYTIYECKDFFIAALKYGISTYYDAIFTIVKFGKLISLEDLCLVIEHAKDSIYNISQIIIVTNAKLNEDSLAYAEKNKILIKTKEELLRSLFDFEPYRKDILQYVKSEQLFTHYIEIYGTSFFKRYERANIDSNEPIMGQINNPTAAAGKVLMKEYVDDFLESEHKALLILGDYGCGKTSFCYIYTLQLLDKFIQGKSSYLPILIKLRGYNKAVGIIQLLTDYFVNSLGINNFNALSLKLLLKNINTVLIFDGFDEIAKKVDFDIKFDVLKEICSLAENETKIIVTCRPNYFQNGTEFDQIFRNSYFPYEPGDKPLPEFIENSIAELDLSQIRSFIESYQSDLKKYSISISEILQTIANTHDLTDLAKRPFLLYMIVNTLPKILKEQNKETRHKINAYGLYLNYTDNWIKREDRKNKTLIKKRDKELLCKELAFELYISNSKSLSYKNFPMAIKKHFKYVERSEDIDYFSHDIQSCSFLTSDMSGDFKFIHRSFMEFFVADRVITKLSNVLKTCKKKEELIKQINLILGKTYLSMEICLFINDMSNYNNENIGNKISILFENINHVAKTNLLSILAKTEINMADFLVNHKISEDISYVDFSNSEFKEKTLQNISCDNVNFYSVNFKFVTFVNCSFYGTIFEKTYLDNVKFYNCIFNFSEWRESTILNCLFDKKINYYYEQSNKYRKRDKFSTLKKGLDFKLEEVVDICDLTNTIWRNSTIKNCTFNGCIFVASEMTSIKIHCSVFKNVNFSGISISGNLEFIDNILDGIMGKPYEF